jgi:hypothetical protein
MKVNLTSFFKLGFHVTPLMGFADAAFRVSRDYKEMAMHYYLVTIANMHSLRTRLSISGFRKWCLEPESNQRHADFQSAALPTELSRPTSTNYNREGT